ncbi:immunity protein [Erwinia sp.]|uniref:immunity protein n=1 Tax=Erwinia citreus TaxID=558 RepID=UPI003C7266AE
MSLQEIIQNESVEDFVTFFGLILSYQNIDRLYTKYRFEVIISSEFLKTFHNLFAKEIFIDDNGKVAKGPNWKEPKFVTEKKYDLSNFS